MMLSCRERVLTASMSSEQGIQWNWGVSPIAVAKNETPKIGSRTSANNQTTSPQSLQTLQSLESKGATQEKKTIWWSLLASCYSQWLGVSLVVSILPGHSMSHTMPVHEGEGIQKVPGHLRKRQRSWKRNEASITLILYQSFVLDMCIFVQRKVSCKHEMVSGKSLRRSLNAIFPVSTLFTLALL